MIAVMGVDPGVRGGLALLAPTGVPIIVRAFKPEMTHRELVQTVSDAVILLRANGGYECFCEKVGYMPGDGGKGANTFGRVDGLIRGALHALKVSVTDVTPMLWQAKMDCLSGGNKNVTKNKAIELFGGAGAGQKITHAIADALLIAEYGRRLRGEIG